MAAIEDVDYLWDNSEKQSYLVYIDSSRRNRVAYPHPNQFVVEFTTPFRFVYGYDILDALIPTTMYNVENDNNKVVIGQIESTRPEWKATPFDSHFFDEFSFVPDITARYMDPTPGSLLMAKKTKLEEVGISESPFPESADDIEFLCEYTCSATSRPDAMHQTKVNVNQTTWYLEDDVPVIGTFHTKLMNIDEHEVATLKIVSKRYLSNINHATIVQSEFYDVRIIVSVVTLPVIQYDSRQLQQILNGLLNVLEITVSHNSSIPEQSNKFVWSGSNPFWFNMRASTCVTLLGFDELCIHGGVPNTYQTFPSWIDPNRRFFLSVFDSDTFQYVLTSPGMIDLTGIPYVVLRAPELEDHAFAGEAHNDCTARGLAIFKLLAAGGGVSNLRFDFVNFTRRPWHPIGKLSRLTLRMEKKDGNLYDFKSINWSILLVLKYLVPAVKTKIPRYTIGMLNSEYQPDAQAFYIQQRRLLNDTTQTIDRDCDETLERVLDNSGKATQVSWKATLSEPGNIIKDLVQKYTGHQVPPC